MAELETMDRVGGLLGDSPGVRLSSGTIIASYATSNSEGGSGERDVVGGLVGNNVFGTIIASYATGRVNSGDGGGGDAVGGLVGINGGTSSNGGSITASYATGAVSAGSGNDDRVGGLVGI